MPRCYRQKTCNKIGNDKHPTRNTILRGIKAFIIQDQDTSNPVFGRVEYPRKGLKPETVAVPLLEIARNIVPNLEKEVFDKWFPVGSLIVAEFGNLTVESVFEEVIEFPAVVKAEADRIVVTFYGNYREKHKVAVETLLR